jgi:hypothetical protein
MIEIASLPSIAKMTLTGRPFKYPIACRRRRFAGRSAARAKSQLSRR